MYSNKFLTELALAIAIFFTSWFLLSQISFVEHWGLNEKVSELEKKLGNFYSRILIDDRKNIDNDSILVPIERIKIRICEANDVKPQTIKLHVQHNSTVNAFALPDNHLVLLSGLIEDAQTPEELAGVMAHEIAHMQHKHVMKKLQKEIGLTVLYSMAGGNGSTEGMRLLSSSAYDREFEHQADISATKYLIKAQIDPEGLANFLYRLSIEEDELTKNLVWISTHPDSEKRSKEIIEAKEGEVFEQKELMSQDEWDNLKKRLKDGPYN